MKFSAELPHTKKKKKNNKIVQYSEISRKNFILYNMIRMTLVLNVQLTNLIITKGWYRDMNTLL